MKNNNNHSAMQAIYEKKPFYTKKFDPNGLPSAIDFCRRSLMNGNIKG